METTVFKKGETISKEGQYMYYVYTILEGEAQFFKEIHGREIPILKLEKCAVIGKLSCIDEAMRTVSVKALTDVKALSKTREDFSKDLYDPPPSMHKSIRDIASLLSGSSGILGELIAHHDRIKEKGLNTLTIKGISDEFWKVPEHMQLTYKSLIKDLIHNYSKCQEIADEINKKLEVFKDCVD